MPKLDDDAALIHECGNDYTLKGDQPTVWITVGKLSVYIVHYEDSVEVRVYPVGLEDEDELASFKVNHSV